MEILSVGGFVSPAPRWSIIQNEWRKARAKAGVPYFHMTDFMSPNGRPYRDWTYKKREAFITRLLTLLNEHALFGVGVALAVHDFHALPEADRALCDNNPYALCAAQCIGLVTKTLEDHGAKTSALYVVETGGTGEAAFVAAMIRLTTASESIREALHIFSVVPGTKKQYPALDSADFFAWEMAQLAQRRRPNELVDLPTYMARLTIPTPHHMLDRESLALWAADLTPRQRSQFRALFRGDIKGMRRP